MNAAEREANISSVDEMFALTPPAKIPDGLMVTVDTEIRICAGGYDSDERKEYLSAVERLKAVCGLQVTQSRSVRELLRDASFENDFFRAIDSELLACWPLGEQLSFFRAVEKLTAPEKSVRIHAQVYGLYRKFTRLER